MSDNQLLEGIRAGGRLRLQLEGILYNQYAYLIRWGTRTHRLRPDECASAYSDTILSVIHQVTDGRFERRSTLKTYLHRIFTNKCVDLMRSNSTNQGRIYGTALPDDALTALPDPARSVVEQLSARYDVAQLQQRLRELSPKSQTLILAWGEGYSDDEIAQQLGYASGAVAKTSRLRCLKQLRELYDRGGA
ncbi:MAG: RNA polymerase sigma factor [Bacteroidetes bacterium]|nr:RNA polymerase sigma factor [Fibrella sp.]